MSLYLVGGVVRDLLLKRENWDLDLAVEGDGIAFARLVADRYGAGLAVFERFATARLAFPHPMSGDPVECESPLPPELQAALDEARLSA